MQRGRYGVTGNGYPDGVSQQPWGTQGQPGQWGAPTPGQGWGTPTPGQWGAPPAQQWPSAPAQWSAPQAGWAPPSVAPPAPPIGYPAPYRGVVTGPGFQPPRPTNPLRSVLIAVIGAIVVLGFVITLISFFASEPDPSPPRPSPSRSTTPVPRPTPTVPTPNPTPNTGVPDPDLNPPELPMPDTYSEATDWMNHNLFYDESITIPTSCAIDPVGAKATVGQLETHLNELTACLWLVWDPPLARAGYELPRPPVTVYSSTITTGCGKLDDVNAVYCAGDQRIYYSVNVLTTLPAAVRTAPFAADAVVAHEFGHAIQARTGILISESVWERRESTSESKAKELSRRLELQADCVAGMFSSAVAAANNLNDAEMQSLRKLFYEFGDDILSEDPTYVGGHGSGVARQAWFTSGTGSAEVKTCNTFIATATEVR